MPRFVLLLRGVNVGATNKLPMADLRSMLEELGCTDVVTYIQSGNAVLGTSLSKAGLLTAVEQTLASRMGRPIATAARTQAELEAIIANNPFADIADDPRKLTVTFLSGPPTVAAVAPLDERDWTPEAFRVAGSEIYAWLPDGQGHSTLAAAIGSIRVDGVATTRNWNTVLRLRDLLADG